jgi:hypothetical protein
MVKPNKIFLKINNNSIDLALSNRTPENKFQKSILEELYKYYPATSRTTTTRTTSTKRIITTRTTTTRRTSTTSKFNITTRTTTTKRTTTKRSITTKEQSLLG